MIIHKLIAHHLKHKDDAYFYQLQADDAVRWIEQCGVPLGPNTLALDLGCGHGVFGSRLARRGCQVTFADERNLLLPELATAPFRKTNLDQDDIATLGQFDLVVCSNVFEHLSKPDQFLDSVHKILAPGGKLYLSWTNWLSPWGGHDWSPLHYLGPRNGMMLYDKLLKKSRNHTIYQNLFPTYIGRTLAHIRRSPHLVILKAAPRYYTELSLLIRIPIVREFLAWNCALLIGRKD
ncbi:MAG TPA: class I SAM-dependent methyltransferase [Verrucomicrobiae bacterium]|nr:class I SAM-dependent methyltransferase [Verrucomicrobiae bacterium]